MTAQKLLVSVIVPTFNSSAFITETLLSVVSQTYPYWELCVVDDGSTDSTISLIEQLRDQYPNIHLYIRDRLPKGGNTCRNIGLEMSKGDYIVFLDSDDLLDSTCLQKRVEYLETRPVLDFAVFRMSRFVEHIGNVQTEVMRKITNPLAHFIALDCIWQITSPIWRRNFLLEIGGFNEKYARLQDVELAFRALSSPKLSYSISDSSDPDCFYRQEVKALNVGFWERGYRSTEQYLEQLISWIQEDMINRKQYKSSVNRTVWNYILYFWRSQNPNYPLLIQKISNLYHLRIINSFEIGCIKLILSLNRPAFRKSTAFTKYMEFAIRLLKKMNSKI